MHDKVTWTIVPLPTGNIRQTQENHNPLVKHTLCTYLFANDAT